MEVLLTFEALDEADYKSYMLVSRLHYGTWCIHQNRLYWNKRKHTLFRNWTLDRIKDGKLSTLGRALLSQKKYTWTSAGPHVYPFLDCAVYKRGDVVAANGDFFVSDGNQLHFYSSTEVVRKRESSPEAVALLDEKYTLRTHPGIVSSEYLLSHEFWIISLLVGEDKLYFELDDYVDNYLPSITVYTSNNTKIHTTFEEIADYIISETEIDSSTLRVIRSCYGLVFSYV